MKKIKKIYLTFFLDKTKNIPTNFNLIIGRNKYFKEIIIMVALIGLIIIAIPVTAFWIYTETPSGKKWIKNL